jgi:hypothetical protein
MGIMPRNQECTNFLVSNFIYYGTGLIGVLLVVDTSGTFLPVLPLPFLELLL